MSIKCQSAPYLSNGNKLMQLNTFKTSNKMNKMPFGRKRSCWKKNYNAGKPVPGMYDTHTHTKKKKKRKKETKQKDSKPFVEAVLDCLFGRLHFTQ